MSKKTVVENRLFLKIITYLNIIFFATLPFVNFTYFIYGGTSTRSIGLILVVAILSLLLVYYVYTDKKFILSMPKSIILIPILLYALSIFLSGVLGLDFNTTFWSVMTRSEGIWYLFNLLIFMFFLWQVVKDEERGNHLIYTIVITSVIYSTLYLLGPEGIGLIFDNYKGNAFTMGNSTFAGMYLFGAFLLSIYYVYQTERKRWWKFLLPLLIVINPSLLNKNIWYGDLSSGLIGEANASSYAVIMSVICLLVIWLVSRIKSINKRRKVVFAILGIGIVTLFFSVLSLLSHDGQLRKVYLSLSTKARPVVWNMSENAIRERPFFGWGADNFERIFEKYYDNKLLQNEYGNEAWFDRAHNVFIDQTVNNGIVGMIFYATIYIIIILCLVYVTLKSTRKKDKVLGSVLITYFVIHIFELQTAFDTTISYPLSALMIVFSIVLHERTKFDSTPREVTFQDNEYIKYISVSVLAVFIVWSTVYGLIPLINAQITNEYIRKVGSAEERIQVYDSLFNSPVDKYAFLWRVSLDFQKAIGENPKVLEDPLKISYLKKEVQIFEEQFRKYVKDNPSNFRAHLNFADVLIYERLFEINKLDEAQTVLDEAIKLVPQAPQSYWMKSVAYLYAGKFNLAKEYAQKAVDINPNIEESQKTKEYIDNAIKNFPNIDLRFFKYI